MRKYNLFNFLEKKMDSSEISTVTLETLERMAFKELALHIAVSYIANTLSKCEFKVFDKGKEDNTGLLYYLLNVSPNANQNSSQFINQLVETYFLGGETLVILHKDHLYCADGFTVDESNPLGEYTYSGITINGQQLKKKFKASEVFHFRLDNQDVKKMVDALYKQYGAILALALDTFKATNGRKYKLLLENYKAGDPAFNELFENTIKKHLQTFIKNDNAVYPQFKGTDLQEFVAGNRTDTADIIAMRKEVFDTTAQAFKIPLSMMYGNITDIKEIVKVYLSFCIDPLADMIGEELTRKKFTFAEWQKGSRVEVDTSCINWVDIFEVAADADKAIASGLASIDDLRPRVRLPKLNTEFSTAHFITKNYELAENMLKTLKSEDRQDEGEDVLAVSAHGSDR
ncbi:MAG: phage portal protein [Akkermansia sp.]|nr:phage portal protein [Akkermansia sp.]